jgi:type II secretory pathway pseudopilin PulG
MFKAIRKIIKNKRGATLVEAILAMGLLGIIAITFLMAIFIATKSIAIADERTTAESLARTQIEYVKQQVYIDAADNNVASYSKLDVSDNPAYDHYSVESYDRSGVAAPLDRIILIPWNSVIDDEVDVDVGLQKIRVVISHDSKEVLTLEGYKVNEGVY